MCKFLLILTVGGTCSGCFISNRIVLSIVYREDLNLERSDLYQVDFCSLPDNAGKLVRTKARYSGIEEYWSLSPLEPCLSGFADSSAVWVEDADYAFETPGPYLPWQKKKSEALVKVHSEYWKYDAIMDVEGYFETGSEEGYGHLNTYESQFVITYLRSIKVVEKPVRE